MEGKVRKKRGLSMSSSSPPLAQNYRLKRTFLMGKRRGSTTPVKMLASHSQTLQNHRTSLFWGDAKDISLSARKLAALLWEIDGMPSPTLNFEIEDNRTAAAKQRPVDIGLPDPSLTTVSQKILDQSKLCSGRSRPLAAKPLRATTNLRNSAPVPSCLGLVDGMQNYSHGLENNLKDVYNGLTASKQLLDVLSRVCGLDQPDCISSTLVSALGVELGRSCNRVSKLIQGQKTEKSEIDVVLKQVKHGIHHAIPSTIGELETEKKLRRRIEKMNRKTEAELAETRESLARAIKELESEKKARRKVEQVCEELARGIWELKRQFAKVREEVEKEREMFHLADLLREERVQMKLSDAKCLYEEKNAFVDKLRTEVEAYLEGTKCGQEGDDSFRHEKRDELEKILKETFQGLQQHQGKESRKDANVNEDEEESDDSDLHSIELSMEEISRSFMWGDAVENGLKRNSVDASKAGRPMNHPPFIQNQKLQMPLLPECSTI